MIIKNISKPIQETLKNRERALARKTKYSLKESDEEALNISDLGARTTFVRMISNKSDVRKRVIQGGELAGNTGTAFSFDVDETGWQPYHSSDKEGIRPISGINDIAVEYKGGYKAIRQATINWTANSLFDLDDLTPHFLSVGMTVLLEWGWVIKNQRLESFFNPITGEISEEAFTNPMPLILRNKGNYDAMAGVISNFEYTLNESGGFNCVTTLTSIGSNLFESQKADSKPAFKTTTSEVGENKQKEVEDSLINAIINIDEIAFYNYMGANNMMEHGNLWAINNNDHTKMFRNPRDGRKGKADPSNNLKHLHIGQEISQTSHGIKHHHAISTKKSDSADTPGPPLPGEISDVYFTDSSVSFDHFTASSIHTSQDIYVRWGWFEDNILSRYTSYAQSKNSPLVNIFRSVEIVFDDNGIPEEVSAEGAETDTGAKQFVYKPVLIRNNPLYLLPKNPMKFFLPGQQIKFDAIEGPFGKFSLDYTKDGKYHIGTIYGIDVTIKPIVDLMKDANENGKFLVPWLKEFLKINSSLPFASSDDNKYGILRNIMINTKEIKEAFGISSEKTVNNSHEGKLYYPDDGISPVSTVKKGMQRLLSALSENFFNYWKFEIVVDPATGNMKAIDTYSTPLLSKENQKLYTMFEGDPPSTDAPTHKVSRRGIYKFPAFTAGSIVKTQNLAFKIPDSMAVTAMYESNKNKGGGVVLDTANEASHIASVFSVDKGDSYKDARLKGLEKAYQIGDSFDGHNIGSPKPAGNIDSETEIIKFDNSFVIDPSDSISPWWCTWTTAPKETDEKIVKGAVDTKKGKYRSPRKFLAQLAYILQGNDDIDDDEIAKLKAKNREINKEISQIYNGESTEYPGPVKQEALTYEDPLLSEGATEGGFGEDFEKNPVSGGGEVMPKKSQQRIEELKSQLQTEDLEGKFYTFKHSDNTPGYELSLFAAGEAVVKAKLFGYDKESAAYQSSFVIPAELSLTVDGISGINPGDIIQTDYIQPKYNQNVKHDGTNYGPLTFFQIFNINQKVSSETWETELTTKMRVNDNVIGNVHAGKIQEILLPPEVPIKKKEPNPVKIKVKKDEDPTPTATVTQDDYEFPEVDITEFDEDDDDDGGGGGDPIKYDDDLPPLKNFPTKTEKLDNDDKDDEETVKIKEDTGAATDPVPIEIDLDAIFDNTEYDFSEFTDIDEGGDDDDDGVIWDDDLPPVKDPNPIEDNKEKKKKEVKKKPSGGQGTITVKTEPKMKRVFPGAVIPSPIPLEQRSKYMSANANEAPSEVNWVSNHRTLRDQKIGQVYGWWYSTPAGRNYINVVFKYTYKPNDEAEAGNAESKQMIRTRKVDSARLEDAKRISIISDMIKKDGREEADEYFREKYTELQEVS
jgi:hypothetical protein